MSENYSIAEIGKRVPFPILPADGATFAIGPDGFKLIMQLSRPKASEIRAVLRDRVDIAVMTIGSTAIIVWRFLSSASGLVEADVVEDRVLARGWFLNVPEAKSAAVDTARRIIKRGRVA